jgi:hypothetical protein
MRDRSEVRGWKAQLAATLIAVLDDTFNSVGATQRNRCRRNVTSRNQSADIGRRPRAARASDEWSRINHETSAEPQLAEQLGITGRPMTEAEISSYHNTERMERVNKNVIDELLWRERSQFESKRKNAHTVDAQFSE